MWGRSAENKGSQIWLQAPCCAGKPMLLSQQESTSEKSICNGEHNTYHTGHVHLEEPIKYTGKGDMFSRYK